MESKTFELNLNGDAFNAFKGDFNQILTKTLMSMEDKDSQYAEISVKMKVTLSEEQVPDNTVVGHAINRNVIVPKFAHTVSSVLQIKSKKDGELSGRYELVWDKTLGKYVMREITDGQMNLFDTEYVAEVGDVTVVDAEFTEGDGGNKTEALTGGKVLALPDKREDDYEYDEPKVGDEMCGDCTYFLKKGDKAMCNHVDGPDTIKADEPACEMFWKLDKEDGNDE